jgi:hypothetical protein
LSHDRRSRHNAARDEDDWVPPPWNRVASEDIEAPRATRRPNYETPVPTNLKPPPPRTLKPHESGFVLGMAVAPAVVGLLALSVSFLPILSSGGSVPRGLMIVIAIQVIAVGILKASEYLHLMRIWFSTLICSAVLVPLLALQVTLLREPYVSWGRGSASPPLVATLVVAMVLLVCAVWAVATSWDDPDQAGLLFMPQAMVVPALIGMRSTILESATLRIFGQILCLAAIAIAISWLLPPAMRLLTPPIAIAVEFVWSWRCRLLRCGQSTERRRFDRPGRTRPALSNGGRLLLAGPWCRDRHQRRRSPTSEVAFNFRSCNEERRPKSAASPRVFQVRCRELPDFVAVHADAIHRVPFRLGVGYGHRAYRVIAAQAHKLHTLGCAADQRDLGDRDADHLSA